MSKIVLLFDRVKVRTASGRYAKGVVVGFDRRTVRIVFDDEQGRAFVPLRQFGSFQGTNVHIDKVESEDA